MYLGFNPLTSVVCGFSFGTSGDAIAVDFCQAEKASLTGQKATTPLITTNATVNRVNAPIYFQTTAQVGSSGNNGATIQRNIFSTGGPWTVLMSWNGDCTSNTNNGPASLASDYTSPATILGGGGTPFGAGNTTSNSGNNGRLNWNVCCTRTNGLGRVYCINGGALSANNTGSASLPNLNSSGTHFNIGDNGSGTADFPLNGSIGRMTLWNHEIPDGLMMEYTNLSNSYGRY